jgi:hypothetical protein
MEKEKLTEYLKEGYPYFKATSGVPAWFLPERSFAIIINIMNEKRLIELSRHLQLSKDIEIPENDDLSPEMWQQACLDWPQLSLVKDVVTALLESVDKVLKKYYQNKLKVELKFVSRIFMVISFAPFIPQGRDILQSISMILGGNTNNPATLITQYVNSVLTDEMILTAKINELIDKYEDWSHWADSLQQSASKFQADYKLIAVTPPLTEELADVLTEMMKEATNSGA